MVSLKTIAQAKGEIAEHIKAYRLSKGLTQQGLAERSDVALPTLRKFERSGAISLESFLKLCMTLGCLEDVIAATQINEHPFSSIDEVLNLERKKTPQRGWRK